LHDKKEDGRNIVFGMKARPVRYRNHIELQIMYDINLPPLFDRIITRIVNSNVTRIVCTALHGLKTTNGKRFTKRATLNNGTELW